jgi:hypothetical protein
VAYVRKVRTASGAVAVQIARMDEVTFLRSLRSCSRSDMAELGTRTKCVGGRWDHRETFLLVRAELFWTSCAIP